MLLMGTALSKAKLSQLRKLRQKKARQRDNRFLIDGWHLLQEALANGWPLVGIVLDRGRVLGERERGILDTATQGGIEIWETDDSQLARLTDTVASQGVAAVAERKRLSWQDFMERADCGDTVRLIALDGVGDPGNCGSILRSAAWFGLEGALLGQGSAELENGKTARSTMGALFQTPIYASENLADTLRELKERGFSVFSAELDGADSLFEFAWPKKSVLVIGNEAHGVSSEVSGVCDGRLVIPRFGKAESLNAAMAASVMLAHWRM